jgi:predicted nucleic acid-binding Zn ribbon protein
MERAGEFLGQVARRLGRPEAALAWLSGSWPGIVGKALAEHTRPLRCEGGRLEILADGKAWRKQLEEMRKEFCAQINRSWGATLVKEIRFVSTPPATQSQSPSRAPNSEGSDARRISFENDNDHTPFLRRKKT